MPASWYPNKDNYIQMTSRPNSLTCINIIVFSQEAG